MSTPFDRYIDYPLEVTIETTGKCNARCIFCPHGELDRKDTTMPDELFLQIVEQLEMIPQEHPFYISPFKVNEMLMDKHIFERIDIINRRLPNASIRVFSNLNAATPEDIGRIGMIRNLSDIDISLNSLDPEEYNRLMGLDLDRTLGNIHLLLRHVRNKGLDIKAEKINISRVAQDAETDTRFMKDFNKKFHNFADIVQPLLIPMGEWINFLPSKAPQRQNQPCLRWLDINLCCTGVAAFCCMDGRAAYPLGNVNDSTALEIYNQPRYRGLHVGQPNKSEVTPCKFCSQ